MMFDFALCLFGTCIALGWCALVTTLTMVCAEEYKVAVVAAVVMVLSIGMVFGIGGAIW